MNAGARGFQAKVEEALIANAGEHESVELDHRLVPRQGLPAVLAFITLLNLICISTRNALL